MKLINVDTVRERERERESYTLKKSAVLFDNLTHVIL